MNQEEYNNLIRLIESGGDNFRIAVQILGEDKTLEYLEQQKELILNGSIKPFINDNYVVSEPILGIGYAIPRQFGEATYYNFGDKKIARIERRHGADWLINDCNYSWIDCGHHSKVKINSFRTLIEECILLIINEYF